MVDFKFKCLTLRHTLAHDRDANNLKSYLSSKCRKSFIMNLCSSKAQMSFIKSFILLAGLGLILQMVLQEELEDHAI